MKTLHPLAIAGIFAIGLFAAGCSSAGGKDAADMAGAQQNALTCAVGEVRVCPCLGQGMGTQSCNTTGKGYGPCMNCPVEQIPPNTAAAGGTTAPPPVMHDAGKPPVTAADAGAKHKDAGSDASTEDSGMVSLPAGAEPGVSCGIGLPALCALDTEKCCVRSLQTDTCIANDAKCTCDLSGCTVMEARCDGPEDCKMGQVCCGTLMQSGSGYQDFTCAAQCTSTGNQRIACHEGDAPCPSGTVCANSQLLTNVQVCVDPASLKQ